MKRSYLSGSEKRKKRLARKEEEVRGKRTIIDVFLKPTGKEQEPLCVNMEQELNESNNNQNQSQDSIVVAGATQEVDKCHHNESQESVVVAGTIVAGTSQEIDQCHHNESQESIVVAGTR